MDGEFAMSALPPVPNFRVAASEPGKVRLNWADYPPVVKDGHRLRGFRIYRSDVEGELGLRIADESLLTPSVFQFEDTDPQAGANRHYVCVAVEDTGFGEAPFGASGFGGENTNGFGVMPFNQRPEGSPLRGYGEAPFGLEAFGM